MQQYILRRTFLNVVVIFFVATIVFAVLRIDPDNIIRNRAQGCTQFTYDQCVKIAKHELRLDKSIPRQYVDYMADLGQLNLGNSYYTKKPVLSEIKDRAGPSIELGLLQIVVALFVALPVGILSAIRQDSFLDYVLRFVAIFFLGIPVFILAILLILVSSRYSDHALPLIGLTLPGWMPDWFGPHLTWFDFFDNPVANLKRMTGPALVGGLGTGAIIMRFLRSQMLEVLRQDYVRTAWSKGLRERVIVFRHALKNALIPVLTVIGLLLGAIVSGNVILETLFSIPGIGFYVVASILQYDYPVVQGIVLVVAVTLVFINLLVDVAYAWLDPRIRYA
ncbi:MAG TPA: ABC transporter permease [Dehalococcoidia bacterium]|nr:ABC transporter permease [Dehalococcoidia bacterium]